MKHREAQISYHAVQVAPELSLAYRECRPEGEHQGVILLIHGFPQTSYQFRHVMEPLARKGFLVLAPDYRGAGASSKPNVGFTKSVMAEDMVQFLDTLEIRDPVHVVGHDIGGMVAFNMAARHPSRVATVNWGECPLPGTTGFEADRTTHAVQQFHFVFHCVPDLALALISGRERLYLAHFFRKISHNLAGISDRDIDEFVRAYEQPGAMRCALETYRAFSQDADECKAWIAEHGRVRTPALGLSGSRSRHGETAAQMFSEVHQPGTFVARAVEGAAHYIAEENPEGFVRETARFIEENSSKIPGISSAETV